LHDILYFFAKRFIYLGVYYYCYETVKAIFEKAKGEGKPMSTPESMLSGALAGCAVVLATHPIWTINVS
jgi:adenine nucleotide transporter 17